MARPLCATWYSWLLLAARLACTRSSNQENQTIDALCSTDGCILGKSTIAAGIVLHLESNNSANNSISSVGLLTGSFSADLESFTTNGTDNNSSALLAPFFNVFNTSNGTGFNVNFSPRSNRTNVALDLSEVQLLAYSAPLFAGSASIVDNRTSNPRASSLILPEDTFAYINFDPSNKKSKPVVLFKEIADTAQWSLPLDSDGSFELLSLQSNSCQNPCSTHGLCLSGGSCSCEVGFTGSRCENCESGHYGPSCQVCSCSNNQTCSDGITGSGLCTTPIKMSSTKETCNCLYGVCNGNGSCDCNAGWADGSDTKCSVCAQGFAQNEDGECRSCAPGCTKCDSQQCQSCSDGLQVSTNNTYLCEPVSIQSNGTNNNRQFETCPDGQYNAATDKLDCQDCSSACKTCYGPSSDQCLECSSPRVILQGACVNFNSDTGVCNKAGTNASQSAENAFFVVNNDRDLCDTIPRLCTDGTIDGYSTNSAFEVTCFSCVEGTSLAKNGTCVTSCPIGQYATGGTSSQCKDCPDGCLTCQDDSGCSTCPDDYLLSNSTCIPGTTCDDGQFKQNSTCFACSSECATCSGSFDSCDSCPDERPILTSDKTCVMTCGVDQYWDSSGAQCASCDATCQTCFGSGKDDCLSCNDTSVLKNGQCQKADCWAGFGPVSGFGVCLESLVTVTPEKDRGNTSKKKSKDLLPIILGTLLGIAAVLMAAFAVVRLYFKNRRREQTQKFQDQKNLEQAPNGLKFWRHLKWKTGRPSNNNAQNSPDSEFFPAKSQSTYSPSIPNFHHLARAPSRASSRAVSSHPVGSRSRLQSDNTGNSSRAVPLPFFLNKRSSHRSTSTTASSSDRGQCLPVPSWPLMDLEEQSRGRRPPSSPSIYAASSVYTISSPTSPHYPPRQAR